MATVFHQLITSLTAQNQVADPIELDVVMFTIRSPVASFPPSFSPPCPNKSSRNHGGIPLALLPMHSSDHSSAQDRERY